MTALVSPLACFVGLAIDGVEVTVAGYVRQPTTLLYCEDGVTIANLASIQWSRALASWGMIDTVQLWDSPKAGTSLGVLPAFTPIAIRQYDIARIPAGGIAFTDASGVFVAINTAPAPFGVGGFGLFGYATTGGVPLERAFDNQHACEPGTWAPGPFARAA